MRSPVVGTAISRVQVKVDGTAVGTATYGSSRPDVVNGEQEKRNTRH
jgi:hypothetical protein